MKTLSARERRAAIVALAAVVGIVIWIGGVEPLMKTGARLRTEIDDFNRRLVSSQRLLTQGNTYQREVEALETERQHLEAFIFVGEKPSLLGANLQRLFKDMAQESDLMIRSEQILATERLGEVIVIPIEISLAGTVRQVADFLYRVEYASRLFTVEQASLRIQNFRDPGLVTAVIRINGFLIPEPEVEG